ncbi:MAG: sulfocyanin-like copper-binding protein [Gemmatimonadota bacterium]
MRIKALTLALFVGVAVVGCGDASEQQPASETPAETAAPAAGLTDADWFVVDHDAQTVEIDLVAGQSSQNNYWNYNGAFGGAGQVTVPAGYEVTINLENQDPNMAHSVGVGEQQASYPANFSAAEPVFEGAVTENPTSLTESTLPGETESITFVADAAGDYVLICYVTGHAVAGMWVPFTVSADGEAGVSGF